MILWKNINVTYDGAPFLKISPGTLNVWRLEGTNLHELYERVHFETYLKFLARSR